MFSLEHYINNVSTVISPKLPYELMTCFQCVSVKVTLTYLNAYGVNISIYL